MAIKSFAEKALDAMYKAETATQGAYLTLFQGAKQAQSLDIFSAAVGDAEAVFKQKHDGENLPRSWTAAKSNIKWGLSTKNPKTDVYYVLECDNYNKLMHARRTHAALVAAMSPPANEEAKPEANKAREAGAKNEAAILAVVKTISPKVAELIKFLTDDASRMAAFEDKFNDIVGLIEDASVIAQLKEELDKVA